MLWMEGFLCSVSLSGKINILDHELKETKPIRIVTGHRAAISDCDFDAVNGALFTVDNAARCVRTPISTAICEDVIGGDVHKAPQIVFVRVNCDSSGFWTIGSNDTLCYSAMAKGGDDVEEKKEEEASSTSLSMGSTVEKLDGAPRGCVAGNVTPELLVVPTHKKKVIVVMGGKVEKEWAVKYSPTCCALSADDKVWTEWIESVLFFFGTQKMLDFAVFSEFIGNGLNLFDFSGD